MHPVHQRYLADADASGAVIELARWSDTPRVPRDVLQAHWDNDVGYDMLKTLSMAFRIVPHPLAPFVADCRRRGRSYVEFLHPHTLYDEPALAREVFCEIGASDDDLEMLHLLRYLAQSKAAEQYRDYVSSFLQRALARACARTRPWDASIVCELCVFYMNPEHMASLDTRALDRLLRVASCARQPALCLADAMGVAAQAKIADALAACASAGSARACRLLQDVSYSKHWPTVAAAVQRHAHCAYVDRLALDTLWVCVPLLAGSGSACGLHRLVASDGPKAVRKGVISALIAQSKHVPDVPPVANPQSVHEAVHYMHCLQCVPPNRFLVDVCMREAPVAVSRLARRCKALRRQIVCAQKWHRRRTLALGLMRGKAVDVKLLVFVQQHVWTWRHVISYM